MLSLEGSVMDIFAIFEWLDKSMAVHLLTPAVYALVVMLTRWGVEFAREHQLSSIARTILEGLSNQEVRRPSNLRSDADVR